MAKAKRQQVRQGDVLLTPIDSAKDAQPVPAEGDLAVLARGEATGHHHSVPLADAAILARGAERFLRANRPTTLRHQEHGPIQIARGVNDITIQVEYDPTVISRTVTD